MTQHTPIKDYRLSAFLVSRGVQYTRTEVNDRNEVVFIFEGKEASELLDQFPHSAEQRYDAACKTLLDLVKVKLKSRGS